MKGILKSGVLHSPSDGEEGLLGQCEQVAGLAQRCSQCSCANEPLLIDIQTHI